MSDARVLRATEHRRMPWANGLGTTREVAVSPEGAADWSWRISLADVAADGPFSSLPGIARFIAVAQGDGMALAIDGYERTLTTADDALAFDGGSVSTCRLLGGPIVDVNLMVRRNKGHGALHIVRAADGDAIALPIDAVAIVVLMGSLLLGDARLASFDAALVYDTTLALRAGTAARVAIARFTER